MAAKSDRPPLTAAGEQRRRGTLALLVVLQKAARSDRPPLVSSFDRLPGSKVGISSSYGDRRGRIYLIHWEFRAFSSSLQRIFSKNAQLVDALIPIPATEGFDRVNKIYRIGLQRMRSWQKYSNAALQMLFRESCPILSKTVFGLRSDRRQVV